MLEKMDVFFENRLAGYDEHMLTTIEGAREFYKFTATQLPMGADSEVLDLGCGTGLELEEYFSLNPSVHITGIDLSAAMLHALSKKFPNRNLHLIHGSYFEVPLEAINILLPYLLNHCIILRKSKNECFIKNWFRL